jgi:hypothetical protein
MPSKAMIWSSQTLPINLDLLEFEDASMNLKGRKIRLFVEV